MSDTVKNWLRRNHLEHLAERFKSQKISLDLFDDLTEVDLADLGLTIGDRKVFLRALRENKSRNSPVGGIGNESLANRISERRVLTIAFIDLVGSTALSTRIDAEELHEVLRSYLGTVKEITESFGGHVLKYLGDGVLSVFGWPVAHEDQNERAVLMALEVVRAVQALTTRPNLNLNVRAGIASGSMVVGDIADDVNDITGPAANLAQRLQSHAQPGEIVVDEATRSTLPNGFQLTALGSHTLKGFSDPVEAFRVDSAGTYIRKQRSSLPYGQPILGRDDELEALGELWSTTRQGHGQIVIIQGEPGIGKTRLVREFLRQHIDPSHIAISFQCFEYRSVSAMYPLQQELKKSAGFQRDDDAVIRRAKLSRFLSSRCHNPKLAFAMFAALLSIADEIDEALLNKHVPDRARFSLELFIELTLGASGNLPMVIILEDAHWADPSTVNYCRMLSEQIADHKILLIVAARPEWVPADNAFLDVNLIHLEKLKRDDSRRIVEQAVGAQLSPTVFEAILQRGEDIPLYLEELARVAADSLPGDELPLSIHSSLLARIDRLGADKPIIHLLAVLGLTFSLEALLEISNYDRPTLLAALARLVDTGMLVRIQHSDQNRYQFRHALIQEAAYASVLRRTRHKLHNQVAEALLTRLHENKFVDPEVLARHLSLASRSDEAIPFWQAAGDRLAGQSAYIEAAQQYEKGLLDVTKLAADLDRDAHEYELRVRLSAALLPTEGWSAERVAENYESALILADRLDDPHKKFIAMHGRFNVLLLRGNLSAARELVDELGKIARQANDKVLLAEALKIDGGCAVHEADFQHAAQCLQESIQIFGRSSTVDQAVVFGTDLVVISHAHLAWANWFLGESELADKHICEALK
ncbi:MAG: adenylate/guanylate cyclase domain-containing protein, partial [Rhizobiaceae bacterium]